MMIDLNPRRRKREVAIALMVADELVKNVTSTLHAAPNELIAHYFGIVFERLDYVATPESGRRIMGYVEKELARRRQVADRLYEATRIPDYLRAPR
jgi:hypothetical protein